MPFFLFFNISFFTVHCISNFYHFLRHCKSFPCVCILSICMCVCACMLGVCDCLYVCAWVCLPCVNAWLTKGICIFNVITLFCMPHKNLWLHSGSSDSAWERAGESEREWKSKVVGTTLSLQPENALTFSFAISFPAPPKHSECAYSFNVIFSTNFTIIPLQLFSSSVAQFHTLLHGLCLPSLGKSRPTPASPLSLPSTTASSSP